MRILDLTITTGNPAELRKFYSEQLGFPEISVAEETDGFSFRSGYTRINVAPGHTDARYHFAFNVRPDQLENAIEFLERNGVELLDNPEVKGSKIIDFPNWLAKSVYFYDPAGNIVEVIARAAIPRAGNAPKFSAASFTGISEIGIVTDDVPAMREWISGTHHVNAFVRHQNTDTFSAMGDDEGLLLLVPAGRKWYMADFEAAHFPLGIKGMNGGSEIKLILP